MPATNVKTWDKVLAALKEDIGEKKYDLWIRKIELHTFENDRLVISTPNVFVKEWLSSNYRKLIARHVETVTGRSVDVSFEVDVSMAKPIGVLKPEGDKGKTRTRTVRRLTKSQIFNLNKDFRLDTFIVGGCNRIAYHASKNICSDLDSRFNPFFVFGGCGLGKTHLLQAITRELTRNYPGKKILYISSEYFINAFIQSVKNPHLLEGFRRRFRGLDALVVDDIHILAGKKATQEEFLHTFNECCNKNAQVVMASDSHPRAISQLRAELSDRFAGGLITELKLPGYQTRLDILKRKAEKFDIPIPHKVLVFLAKKLERNIRVLEGALNAVVASAIYCRREVTVDLAWLTIRELADKKSSPLSLEEIENRVISKFSVSSKDLHSRTRSHAVLVPRQVCMYLARRHTRYSLNEIGRYFSGRNHSVVLHAEKRIQELMKRNGTLRRDIETIEEELT